MPELPEVETIRRDLNQLLTGKTIQSVEVPDPRVLTGISPLGLPFRNVTPAQFRKNILLKTIKQFHRRGKYLVMQFADGTSLIFHLRMTGQLVVRPPAGKERLVIHCQDGTALCFADHRRFGEVVYSSNWKSEKSLQRLGLEPLEGGFTGSRLRELLRNRTAPIHAALLNQKLVSGIGNIYATEALFIAGITPTKAAGRLNGAQAEKLVSALKQVLQDSIRYRGYTLATYLGGNGQKGSTQKFTIIYGKKGQSCAHCGDPIRKKVIAGRGVTYCSTCQSC